MAIPIEPRRRLRADDIFFPAMAVLILGIVVTGFGRSYFFVGMVRAKLPNALVHIHGALFVSWIFLLLIQTMLVAVRKVRWHITLGVLGIILPPLMVIFGTLTLFDSIRRAQSGVPPEILLVGDMEQLILFIVLIFLAMIARRNAASHKRLMVLGTLAILGPAIDRWNFGLPVTIGVSLALPLLIVAYDLCLLRHVHRSTAMGYAMIATMILTLLPVSSFPVWQHCIHWIRHN